jgi:MFS superfamily sulfate permease-like transporter
LLANGVSTLAGAFFQAMPSAGGFSQSAVSRGAGAKTQLSQLTTVVLAVFTAFFLGPVLSQLPEAVLSALVIMAVSGLISFGELTTLARFSRPELVVALAAAGASLVAGLLASVGIGIGLTILLLLHELNQVPLIVLGLRDDGQFVPGGDPVDGMLIVRVGAPLYTANARTATRRVEALATATGRPIEVVLIDGTVIGGLTTTVLAAVRESERELAEHGILLWIAALPPRAVEMALRTPGWSSWADAGRAWPMLEDAVAAYRRTRLSPAEPQPAGRPPIG